MLRDSIDQSRPAVLDLTQCPLERRANVPRPLDRALATLADVGVTTFAVTAIARDGLLGGPDLDLLESCLRATNAGVIASGGIRSVEDLEAVRNLGCSGAIVGRAIYDGSLDLALAISVTRRDSSSSGVRPS